LIPLACAVPFKRYAAQAIPFDTGCLYPPDTPEPAVADTIFSILN
jgi:hypothetical protein